MRICIIGYCNTAQKHIDAFRALGCEVVASSNRSEKGNLAAQIEGRIPTTYTNYMEMVEKETPDAIVNCVSSDNMFETTKNLIPLGVPLLIEKPAGLSVAETKILIALQQQYGTPVQVALNRRHYSVFNKALEMIGGRQNLDMLTVEWSERPKKAAEQRNHPDTLIAKQLFTHSIHGIDILDYFSGGVENYTSYCSAKEGFFHWQMALSGVSKLGVLTTFTSAWASPVPWRVIMYAQGKRFEFAPLETCKIFDESTQGFETIEPETYDVEYKAGFYLQVKSFLELIKTGGNEHANNLQSTLGSMEIAEHLYNKLYPAK